MFVFRVSILLILIAAAALRPVTSRDAMARSGPRVVSAATSGQWQILGAAKGRPSFVGPTGVAADAQGNVYVANTGANSIVKVSHTGQLLATWGTSRTSSIQFDRPNGVALDVHGNIYVADTGNSRVVKLSPTGMPLARWGTRGIGPRQFDLPSATALDSQGNIYVADTGNHRVVKLSPAGAPLTTWDTNAGKPTDADQCAVCDHMIESPYGIAVSATGTVYVPVGRWAYSSYSKDQQQLGNALQQWSTDGKFAGEQAFPSGSLVTIDIARHMDSHGDLQIPGFTSDPVLKLVQGVVGRALGGIAVDRPGNVYMTSGYGRVYKFSPKGATLARWGTSGADAGRFFMPQAIAIDTHNHIYVADAGNNRLQELSPRGLPIATWPVTSPTSVAVDARGTIYVGSRDAHYVGGSLSFLLRKPAKAHALTPWITTGKGVGDPPNALAVDARGNVYLTGGGNNVGVIQKFSPAGVLLTRFRLQGQISGRVAWVAVDRAGNIYVTNTALFPIQKFSATGKLLASWGKWGAKPDQFMYPGGIAIDHEGNIYVVDSNNNGIHKLSPQGKQLAVWATVGGDPGQFRFPLGVAIDSQDNLYVLDAGNNRIQELPSGH